LKLLDAEMRVAQQKNVGFQIIQRAWQNRERKVPPQKNESLYAQSLRNPLCGCDKTPEMLCRSSPTPFRNALRGAFMLPPNPKSQRNETKWFRHECTARHPIFREGRLSGGILKAQANGNQRIVSEYVIRPQSTAVPVRVLSLE
jgi:hypothetical protein